MICQKNILHHVYLKCAHIHDVLADLLSEINLSAVEKYKVHNFVSFNDYELSQIMTAFKILFCMQMDYL